MGSTEKPEVEVITYEKEYIEPLIEEQLNIVSPPNNSSYKVGEEIVSVDSIEKLDKYKVAVELNTTSTEQFRYRKYVNGIASEPPEYSNNGVVYAGTTTNSKKILKSSDYEFTVVEQRGEIS